MPDGDAHQELPVIFKLLRQTTSLAVVKDFLKAKGLRHSAASWDDLQQKRVEPALASGDLAMRTLIELLRDCEEHGRQHVFLYKASQNTASTLLDNSTVEAAAVALGIQAVIEEPIILDTPEDPTITDIRWEQSGELVIKIIETKESLEQAGETVEGNFVNKKFERVFERVVNVVKLHKDGLLEIRIGSRRTTGGGYSTDLERMWGFIAPFIDRDKFRPLSRGNAKNAIWDQREQLKDRIRYSDATLKNDHGTLLRAATGSREANLHDDTGATDSMAVFMDNSAYCDSNNIFFKPGQDAPPSREIHVLISGEQNEFALTVHCPKADYEHVLSQLKELNKAVS